MGSVTVPRPTLRYALFSTKGPPYDADLLKHEGIRPTKKTHQIQDIAGEDSADSDADQGVSESI